MANVSEVTPLKKTDSAFPYNYQMSIVPDLKVELCAHLPCPYGNYVWLELGQSILVYSATIAESSYVNLPSFYLRKTVFLKSSTISDSYHLSIPSSRKIPAAWGKGLDASVPNRDPL